MPNQAMLGGLAKSRRRIVEIYKIACRVPTRCGLGYWPVTGTEAQHHRVGALHDAFSGNPLTRMRIRLREDRLDAGVPELTRELEHAPKRRTGPVRNVPTVSEVTPARALVLEVVARSGLAGASGRHWCEWAARELCRTEHQQTRVGSPAGRRGVLVASPMRQLPLRRLPALRSARPRPRWWRG